MASQPITVNRADARQAAARCLRAGGSRTLVDHFVAHARERGDADFIRCGGRVFSYGEIAGRVDALAAQFAATGIGHGDRVAIAMANRPAFVVAFLAILSAGATAVPLNVQYKPDEYRYALAHARCAALVTEPAQAGRIGEALALMDAGRAPALFVAGADEGAFDAAPPAGTRAAGAAQRLPRAEDLAGVFYTSGTTARPKGVMITHAGMIHSAEVSIQALALGREDVPALAFPLFHVNSLFYGVLTAIVLGGAIGLLAGFSVSRYLDDATAVGASWSPGITGPLMRLLLQREPVAADRAHGLRFAVGGTFLSLAEVAEFGARFGIEIVPAWSMTETVCLGTVHPRRRGMALRSTTGIGYPTLGQEIRLLGDDGSDAAIGESGEIVYRSPGIFAGYLDDAEATAAAFVDGDWFRTGDLAVADEDGYLAFVDRKKDMIKSRGENVAAAEVERVINDFPGVVESAVIGVRDDSGPLGERVEAFVVMQADAALDAEALRGFVRERLADFKVPAAVHRVEALPKTPLGKIQRAQLKRASNPAT